MPNFPSSGGALSPAWLGNTFYVSPTGSDSADGKAGTPMRTIYAALLALRSAGGGTLYVDSDCTVGGPIDDQGINIGRWHDFTPTETWLENSGFITLDVPINIVGMGNDVGNQAFTFAPMTNFEGGGFSRFKPRFGIVGSGNAQQLTISNLQGTSGILGANVGWDYDRNIDGTIKHLTITNATRTGTSTVFTVTLPTGITVQSASRTANVTTLYIANPGIAYMPWRIGQVVKFTSTDPDFASGDYTVTVHNNEANQGDNQEWTISYAEVAADEAFRAIAASSVQSHNCSTGEYVDLVTSNVHWLNTRYYVTAATSTAITVTDNQGDGNQNVNNIGTLVHQEREYGHTNMVQLNNCSFSISQNPDAGFVSGHSFDFGANLAVWPIMKDCWINGNQLDTDLVNADPRITASVFVYGGLHAGASLVMRRCQGIGQVYHEASGDGLDYFEATDCLIEAVGFGVDTRPGIYIRGNTFMRVYIDNFERADAAAGAVSVELYGMPAANSIVTRAGVVRGVCTGGDHWRTPNDWLATDDINSPWQGQNGLQQTSWADSRIAGIHPASVRGGGPVTARFKNIVLAPASWTHAGGNGITDGIPGPFGALNGTLITSPGGGSNTNIFPASVDGNTWEVGGRFVIAGWFCSQLTGTYLAATAHVIANPADVTFDTDMPNVTQDGTGVHFSTPVTSTGWQFMQWVAPVATVGDSTPTIAVNLTFGNSEVFVYGLTAYYVPLSQSGGGDTVPITNFDAYEYAGTVHSQPRYLLPGMAGTQDNQKFIAHAGVGIATGITNVVGVGSGQLTLTGAGTIYEPRYGADGTTILGWVALLQATINP